MYGQVTNLSSFKFHELFNKHRRKAVLKTFDPIFKGYEVDLRQKDTIINSKLDLDKRKGNWRDHLPFQETSVFKFVRMAPWYEGWRPTKLVGVDKDFLQYLQETSQVSDILTPERSGKLLVQPSWPFLRADMEKVIEPSAEKLSVYDLISTCFARGDKLILPKIEVIPKVSMLRDLKVVPEAFPGVLSKRLLGNTKGDCYHKALYLAERLFEKAGRVVTQDTSLWSFGGRARINKIEDGQRVRSRIVLMPEMPSSMIASIYSELLMFSFKPINYNFENEIALGITFLKGGWLQYREKFSKFVNIYHSDWSKFDTTVTEPKMILAFAILRSCFPKSKMIDNHFLFIASGFINKHVLLPGGFIYILFKIIPSGSPFTSLIGSIVNWICTSHLMVKAGHKDCPILCYGDDTVAGLPLISNFLPEDFVRVAKDDLGMILDPVNISAFDSTEDTGQGSSFLQTFSIEGLPSRTTDKLVERMMFQEWKAKSKFDKVWNLMQIASTGPGNILGIEIIRKYLLWLYRRVKVNSGLNYFESVFNSCFDLYTTETLPSFLQARNSSCFFVDLLERERWERKTKKNLFNLQFYQNNFGTKRALRSTFYKF